MPKIDLADRLARTRDRLGAEPVDPKPAAPEPLFARLTRKEARVREDQYAALSALARTLMRRRRTKAERITENTLIRVAIDLLLAHQHVLAGATEHELRKSVTSRLPECATSDVTNSGSSVVSESGSAEGSGYGTAEVPGSRPSAVREGQR